MKFVSSASDPLVGDPLPSEKDRTSGVQRLALRKGGRVVVEPEDGGVATRSNGDVDARKHRRSSEFYVRQVDHEGRQARGVLGQRRHLRTPVANLEQLRLEIPVDVVAAAVAVVGQPKRLAGWVCQVETGVLDDATVDASRQLVAQIGRAHV